jgi:Glycosyl transferases group 1
MKVKHIQDRKASQKNRYVMIDINPREEIDVLSSHGRQWEGGRSFYLDVCKHIEMISDVSGLIFYISGRTPVSLPRYGQDVVLVLLGDELYAHRAYHHRLLAIFRCVPPRPIYLDGIPTSAKHLSYLAQYSYKYFQYVMGLVSILRNREWPHIHESTTSTMMIPYGCFADFEPDVIPMCDRDLDYAFLGSVTYNANEKKWFHAAMESPKELARRVMCEGIQEVSRGDRWHGFLHATNDMKESISNPLNYADILARSKISLVPRGTCYDTYRFFESLKAGCVVICEPLPDLWFYEGHPGITITDWRDLPQLLDRLLSDPELLERKSQQGVKFYNERCAENVVADRMVKFLNLRLANKIRRESLDSTPS